MGTNALSGPAINRSWENEKARELIVAPGTINQVAQGSRTYVSSCHPRTRVRKPRLQNRAGFIRFGEWLQIGAIKFPHTTIGGLERARKRTRSRRKIVIPSLSL